VLNPSVSSGQVLQVYSLVGLQRRLGSESVPSWVLVLVKSFKMLSISDTK
jgi:hypothetical protein